MVARVPLDAAASMSLQRPAKRTESDVKNRKTLHRAVAGDAQAAAGSGRRSTVVT